MNIKRFVFLTKVDSIEIGEVLSFIKCERFRAPVIRCTSIQQQIQRAGKVNALAPDRNRNGGLGPSRQFVCDSSFDPWVWKIWLHSNHLNSDEKFFIHSLSRARFILLKPAVNSRKLSCHRS
ncbi:hypothetical protein CEXT_482081 [Caerostris extrusa]|uniref:Uncharacterized protein n=1 Tax=Caerostris extrusa TaxID=172846 RepID=A0AAV4NVA2_CAEEX|nr:hypothetical protein CEXT_482081 [Caerostris extrusa]